MANNGSKTKRQSLRLLVARIDDMELSPSQDELPGVNTNQVRELLGGEHLRRLIERLRKRLSRGESLTGKIQLSHATPFERNAINRLMGRLASQGGSLTIDLDKLSHILAHAKACERLEDAVITILGPVTNARSESMARKERWERLWRKASDRMEGNLAAVRWIKDLKSDGLLIRMADRDIRQAEILFDQAVSIVEQVPLPAVRLAELAAMVTGNSHALDRGQPLAALTIRFARQADGSTRWKTAAERRDAWELLGVLCDEVSAPVLVLNLRADSESLTGKALNLHAVAGEPYRISVRQLRRHPPVFDPTLCGQEVFVCENPTVVDVAANKLGSSCAPLICIDGQPKTASRLLLDALTAAGTTVRYHGDFDWDGIRIANTIIQRHRAVTWRFNASDYADASGAEHPLKGVPVSAEWDRDLRPLMERVGICVHEEYVLNTLLTDLDLRRVPQPTRTDR